MGKEIYFIKNGQCFKLIFRKCHTDYHTGKKVCVKGGAKAQPIPIPAECYHCGSCK